MNDSMYLRQSSSMSEMLHQGTHSRDNVILPVTMSRYLLTQYITQLHESAAFMAGAHHHHGNVSLVKQ